MAVKNGKISLEQLSFGHKTAVLDKKKYPITILWPGDMPADAMPAFHSRLSDGRWRAMYVNEQELRESIHVLALVIQAGELGGVTWEFDGDVSGDVAQDEMFCEENYYSKGG